MDRRLPRAGSQRRFAAWLDRGGADNSGIHQWRLSAGARRDATLLGLATLVFSASSVLVELHDAMNTIWHVSPPRDRTNAAAIFRLIKDRFYSFATVLGTGFLLLLSLALNAWIEAGRISVPRTTTFLISFLVITALFATLYKIVPDVSLRWSDVAPGAVMTSLLFMLGKEIMGFYFAHTSFGSAYSAAGSPMVVFLWVYYSAQLFFWGAEFSKVCKRPWNPRATGIVECARGTGCGHRIAPFRGEDHQYGEN